MPQKLSAEPCALMGVNDEAWNIRYNEVVSNPELYNPEIGHQSRKGIRGDFRLGCGDMSNQRGLANAGHTNKANIRH